MSTPEPGPRRRSYTISQWMTGIAALAVVLSVPHARSAAELRAVAVAVLALPVFLTFNLLLEATVGVQCPCCGRWRLMRLARGNGYYRCAACRARVKRTWFGPWQDASGPADADRYGPPVETRAWRGFAVPGTPGDSTSGRLLAGKRRRSRPGGPGRDA